jgi:hypothetical protein
MNSLVLQAAGALNRLVSSFPVRPSSLRCPMTTSLLRIRLNIVLSKISIFKEGNYAETISCLRNLVYTAEDLGPEFEHLRPKFEDLQVLVLSCDEDLVLAENIIKEILVEIE